MSSMRGNALKAAQYINTCHEKHGKKVFALDIPSGLGGDQLKKKKIPCEIIKADYTITFHAREPVHMRRFAARYCGEILVADMWNRSRKTDDGGDMMLSFKGGYPLFSYRNRQL